MTLPEPDPAWDYSQIYLHLTLAKDALDRAIAVISKQETANNTTDSALTELLETLQGEASKAINCLRHKPDLSAFNAAYEALSPEYKAQWDDIVANHPWIIRE
jgi:hypothetical protein